MAGFDHDKFFSETRHEIVRDLLANCKKDVKFLTTIRMPSAYGEKRLALTLIDESDRPADVESLREVILDKAAAEIITVLYTDNSSRQTLEKAAHLTQSALKSNSLYAAHRGAYMRVLEKCSDEYEAKQMALAASDVEVKRDTPSSRSSGTGTSSPPLPEPAAAPASLDVPAASPMITVAGGTEMTAKAARLNWMTMDLSAAPSATEAKEEAVGAGVLEAGDGDGANPAV